MKLGILSHYHLERSPFVVNEFTKLNIELMVVLKGRKPNWLLGGTNRLKGLTFMKLFPQLLRCVQLKLLLLLL